jgi:peptide/nickel transport system permease protein
MYYSQGSKSNWWGFIGKRAAIAVAVFFVYTIAIFAIIHLDPPHIEVFPAPSLPKAQLEKLYEQFGIDTSPLSTQYFHWIGDVFTGDWKESYTTYPWLTDSN